MLFMTVASIGYSRRRTVDPPSPVGHFRMQLTATEALADELLRHSTLPTGTVILTRLEANPARLLLEARQVSPARAGIVAVSQLAAEDDGSDAVTDAFAELMAHIERDALPTCVQTHRAPLLLIRTSLGWHPGPDR